VKIDIKEAIKAGEIFWDKFGSKTIFKTKDEYLKWVKDENDKFNALPEDVQNIYLEQRKKSIKMMLDTLENSKQNAHKTTYS
jgi:hypothetical protein